MSASTSDMLTALKNLVTALNNVTQTYLNINGTVNAANISTPTVVKPAPGRLAIVSVVTAGSTVGKIYDGATIAATTKPLGVIPMTTGVYSVNLAVSVGILVVPGVGQVVSVGYS